MCPLLLILDLDSVKRPYFPFFSRPSCLELSISSSIRLRQSMFHHPVCQSGFLCKVTTSRFLCLLLCSISVQILTFTAMPDPESGILHNFSPFIQMDQISYNHLHPLMGKPFQMQSILWIQLHASIWNPKLNHFFFFRSSNQVTHTYLRSNQTSSTLSSACLKGRYSANQQMDRTFCLHKTDSTR